MGLNARVDGAEVKFLCLYRAVEVGLKYKFLSSWKYVLRVLGTFYEVAGRHETCVNFMTKVWCHWMLPIGNFLSIQFLSLFSSVPGVSQ